MALGSASNDVENYTYFKEVAKLLNKMYYARFRCSKDNSKDYQPDTYVRVSLNYHTKVFFKYFEKSKINKT